MFFALNHTFRTSWLYSYMPPSHVEIPNIFRQCHFYSQKYHKYDRIIAYHVNMFLTETIYTDVHVSKNNSGLPCAPILNLIFVYDFFRFFCFGLHSLFIHIQDPPKNKMHTHALDVIEYLKRDRGWLHGRLRENHNFIFYFVKSFYIPWKKN